MSPELIPLVGAAIVLAPPSRGLKARIGEDSRPMDRENPTATP